MPATGLRTATRTSVALAALAAVLLGSMALLGASRADAAPDGVPGVDVSGHQGDVDWRAAWNSGARFAYVKATEGTGFRNSHFAQQYNGSYEVGMIRGAYHFARPDVGGGAAQADYFVANGGGWTADGKTLPPLLDIEYNPYGDNCYGRSHSSMIQWIRDFSERVHEKTGRWPMVYTTTDWWKSCTGNTPRFAETHPLFIARYSDRVGELPGGWGHYTMWQYSDSGPMPGDQDTFNGSMEQLRQLALGDAAREPEPEPKPEPKPEPEPEPTTPKPEPEPEPDPTTEPAPSEPDSPEPDPSEGRDEPSADQPPEDAKSSTPAPDESTSDGAASDDAASDDAVSEETPADEATPEKAVSDDPAENAGSENAENAGSDEDTPQKGMLVAGAEGPTSGSGGGDAQAQAPAQDQAAASDAGSGYDELAATGVDRDLPRMAVFAAAMIVLGLIVLTLTRAPARRR